MSSFRAEPSHEVASVAAQRMKVASKAYSDEKILGSADKDVVDAHKAKVTGGELDTSEATRKLGLALLGCPLNKRLALSCITLELVRLRAATDTLHGGCWEVGQVVYCTEGSSCLCLRNLIIFVLLMA